VTGPLAQRRQRRRRITPNTNTTTTTTISTHNHVDMAASLVGAGAVQADATAAHPGKQLGHGQATRRARIDGNAKI
jgi:D-arabinose 5-phosphate isomerase GutQ